MRLLSFRMGGRARYGAVTEHGVVDLSTPDCPDLKTALATSTPAALTQQAARADRHIPLDEIEFLPTIPNPDKILCIGYNYRRHVVETGAAMPTHPSIFVRFPGSQVGHDQPVLRPFLSEMFDFEGELAVVIGKPGRHIPAARAFEHVAGYSCFAENSVRDFQRHTGQATAGKNFEASGAFGPWLVTADEIPDPAALTLVTRVSGTEMQRSGIDDLIFSVPDLIAYASSFARLLPGDVIVTGTPSGVGSARKPPLWLKAGDIVEIEISSIGTLRNPVVDEARS